MQPASFVAADHTGTPWLCHVYDMPTGPVDRDCVRVVAGPMAGHLGLLRGSAQRLPMPFAQYPPSQAELARASAHFANEPIHVLVYITDLPYPFTRDSVRLELPNPLIVQDVAHLDNDAKRRACHTEGNKGKLLCNLRTFLGTHMCGAGPITCCSGHGILIENVQETSMPCGLAYASTTKGDARIIWDALACCQLKRCPDLKVAAFRVVQVAWNAYARSVAVGLCAPRYQRAASAQPANCDAYVRLRDAILNSMQHSMVLASTFEFAACDETNCVHLIRETVCRSDGRLRCDAHPTTH